MQNCSYDKSSWEIQGTQFYNTSHNFGYIILKGQEEISEEVTLKLKAKGYLYDT